MGLNLNMNTMNQVVKGITIYDENQPVESVSLILKGRVAAQRDGIQVILGTGNFLGIYDIYNKTNSMTYTAVDNAVIYPFPIRSGQDIRAIVRKSIEYGGLMVASLSRNIRDLHITLEDYRKEAEEVYSFLNKNYEIYLNAVEKEGYEGKNISDLDNLKPLDENVSFDQMKTEYYKACAAVPMEVQKAFYQSETICMYHIEEQIALVGQLNEACVHTANYLKNALRLLFDDSENSLFRRVSHFIMEMTARKNPVDNGILKSVDQIVEKINAIDLLLEKNTGKEQNINREELEKIYYMILSGETPENILETSTQDKLAMLENSLNTILDAGEIENDVREEFCALLEQFRNAADKTGTDDASRKLRKRLSAIYYDIYKEVFLKVYNKADCPLAVDMFLNFGLLDEKLLRKEQLEELAELEITSNQVKPCNVYTMKQWLTLIYTGKKMPSKSEFDLDYEENLRSLRKNNEITDEELQEKMYDLDERLDYEIKNMFRYNSRLVNGQILTFVPFLHEDSFLGGVRKMFVTKNRVNQAVSDLEAIDYSIFVREVIYSNDSIKVNREYIVKKVYPDIILFPVSGENMIMWQEISGRKRDSKGRFLAPIFTAKKLDDLLVKVFGRYHWEICRTIQGSAWNNIKYKSLTSEYMDYIQFYRKNHELSEEKKEKLKAQILKCRNNSREVFVMDYEAWVRNESQGAIRLNKVVREMLATYCPFNFEIRESIKNQPMFAEAMNRFQKEHMTKIRNYELRIHGIEKDGFEVPDEIRSTYEYYKNS